MNAAVLAIAYLRHHWGRSLVLVLVAALILSVPIVSQVLLRGSERALTDRAEATPLLLGRRGSQLDLVMNALYFSEDRAEALSMADNDAVWDGDLGLPIPLHTAFETNGARIVGTSLDYFEFRGLSVAAGRQIAVLGEAVIGARVADRLGIGPGATLVSSPENLFDLDGVYPLEMDVVGVLAATGTADDEAVFVDIKTAWIIAGIGHGHEDVVAQGAGPDGGPDVEARPDIVAFNRITPETLDSFHFHGDPEAYPVSAVLVVPRDERSALTLRGRHLDPADPVQVVVPREVVGELVDRIFRVKALLDAVTVIVGAAAVAAVALALFLSWRLRSPELRTAVMLGARRGMIAQLVSAEIVILLAVAILIALCIVSGMTSQGDRIVAWLLAIGP